MLGRLRTCPGVANITHVLRGRLHAPVSPHPVRPIFQPVAVAVGFQCLVLLRHLPADFLCALGIARSFEHIGFRFGFPHPAFKLALTADLVVKFLILVNALIARRPCRALGVDFAASCRLGIIIFNRGLPEQPVGNAARTMPAVYPEQPVRLAEARLRQRNYLVLPAVDVGYLGSPAGA